MDMNRRSFPASAASLPAISVGSGCIRNAVGRNAAAQTDLTVTVSTVERRPPAEPEKLDEDEKPTDLEIDVTLVEADITPSSTARGWLTYTNTGEDTLELNIDPQSPDPLPSKADDPGLILLSDAYDPTRAAAGCWKPDQERFPSPRSPINTLSKLERAPRWGTTCGPLPNKKLTALAQRTTSSSRCMAPSR